MNVGLRSLITESHCILHRAIAAIVPAYVSFSSSQLFLEEKQTKKQQHNKQQQKEKNQQKNNTTNQFDNSSICSAEQLFTLEFYANIVGMFELNNHSIEIPSPVETYVSHVHACSMCEGFWLPCIYFVGKKSFHFVCGTCLNVNVAYWYLLVRLCDHVGKQMICVWVPCILLIAIFGRYVRALMGAGEQAYAAAPAAVQEMVLQLRAHSEDSMTADDEFCMAVDSPFSFACILCVMLAYFMFAAPLWFAYPFSSKNYVRYELMGVVGVIVAAHILCLLLFYDFLLILQKYITISWWLVLLQRLRSAHILFSLLNAALLYAFFLLISQKHV